MKWLKRSLLLILAGEFFYLLVANSFLRFHWIPALINSDPKSLWLDYDSAWTLWPGIVHLQGTQFRLEDNRIQLHFRLGQAKVNVCLSSLFQKKFEASRLEAKELVFRLRERTPGQPPSPKDLRRLPPIPGTEVDEPLRPERKVDRNQLWQVELRNILIAGLREIWIGPYRFQGQAEVGGAFHLTPATSAWVQPAFLTIRDGQLWSGKTLMASNLKMQLTGKIRQFEADRIPGWTIFRYLSAQVGLQGQLRSLKWLTIPKDQGKFRARLALDDGKFREGSFVEGQAMGAKISLATLRARADLDLKSRFRGSNLENGGIEIDGTQLSLSGLELLDSTRSNRKLDAPKWWGLLEFPEGRIDLGESIALSGRIRLMGKDARPLIGLVGPSLPGIVKGIFAFENLSAHARFNLDHQNFTLDNAEAIGGATKVQGWLHEQGKGKKGRALVEYGPLRAGLELTDGKTSLRLLDPERWYHSAR
jgi:hypothetical protein